MINKIYNYGCSFSYPFWIDESETYFNHLKKELKCDGVSRAYPALCNEEIFSRLLNDLNDFQSNDLIIYQFTAGFREGYIFYEKDNLYYSTAALVNVKHANEMMEKWGGGRNKYPFTDEQLEMLVDYTNNWSEYKLYYRFYNVKNILDFLKKTKKINYVFLFLDDSFEKFLNTDNCILFEADYKNTISISKWLEYNKIRLCDFKDMPFENDLHPSPLAHKLISEKIQNYFDL